MANFSYDPNQHKEAQSFEALPAGWYPAVIIESDIVQTAKKDGFRLVMTYQIIDGPHKGRKVMAGYNIDNPNPKAVEISMSELKSICSVIGKFNPIGDTQELHNQPLQIRLVQEKDSDYNTVKGYKDLAGNDPGKSLVGQGAPVGHQVQPQQGFGNPPQQFAAPAPAYAPQPQYAPAPPAYAPPAPAFGQPAPAFGQPAPQQYAPQPPAQPQYAPAPPAYGQPPAGYQQQPPQQPQQPQAAPTAPAWAPNATPPAAPAWAPQR